MFNSIVLIFQPDSAKRGGAGAMAQPTLFTRGSASLAQERYGS
jgi:hypothetical protein